MPKSTKERQGLKEASNPYIILSLLTRKASVSKKCLEQVQSSELFPHLPASWDTLSLLPWLALLLEFSKMRTSSKHTPSDYSGVTT